MEPEQSTRHWHEAPWSCWECNRLPSVNGMHSNLWSRLQWWWNSRSFQQQQEQAEQRQDLLVAPKHLCLNSVRRVCHPIDLLSMLEGSAVTIEPPMQKENRKVISAATFVKMCQLVDLELHRDAASAVIRSADANGDAAADWSEFVLWYHLLDERVVGAPIVSTLTSSRGSQARRAVRVSIPRMQTWQTDGDAATVNGIGSTRTYQI